MSSGIISEAIFGVLIMKFKTHLHKFKIVEVPVIFTDRTRGESKMSSGIISEAIFGVLIMKFKSVFTKYEI